MTRSTRNKIIDEQEAGSKNAAPERADAVHLESHVRGEVAEVKRLRAPGGEDRRPKSPRAEQVLDNTELKDLGAKMF